MARTTNGGTSWVALPAPSAGYVARGDQGSSTVPAVSEVRFADELDGWIYGPALFATHDGGASWQQVPVSGSVISLETSGGYVFAVVSPCTSDSGCTGPLHLERALADGGTFSTVLTGPSTGSSSVDSLGLSLHAPVGFANLSGYFTGFDYVYATKSLADANGWNSFPDPCVLASGSYFVSFSAPDATSLYTLCTGSGAAGSEMKVVVKTTGGKSTVVGNPPSGGDSEGLALSPTGTMVVAAASGASELYRSTDGGSTWMTVAAYEGGASFNDLGFTNSNQGAVIHGLPGPGTSATQLLMTRDGGASWFTVPIS